MERRSKTVREWAPSQWDAPLSTFSALADKQDWLVAPTLRARDSEALPRSNFNVALCWLRKAEEALGSTEGEGMVELHRFHHWGCGWYEVLLVHPKLKAEGERIEAKLENYPILDEMNLAQLEAEDT